MANERLLGVVLATVLAVIIGWVLYIGKAVLVPIVFAVLLSYVILGLARLLQRVPLLGAWVPRTLLVGFSVLAMVLVVAAGGVLLSNNIGRLVQLAPQLQESLLSMIQGGAARLGIEVTPTWQSLRTDVLDQVNLQRLVGSTVVSLTSVLSTIALVLLYVGFLLLERSGFDGKVGRLSGDPVTVTRIRHIIGKVNERIGAYLALKTLINILLGVVSWLIMLLFGLELAAFWAVLIAVMNYVPYIGSFLGVLFPVAFAVVQLGDPGPVLALAGALIAAQFLIGNMLEPLLMGNSLNLSPFVILVTLAIWSGLWGVAGAFLSVPMTAVVALALSEFPQTRAIAVLLSRNGKA
ncbi:MAG: AI-2E family transporter [Xanthomonadales bacterium]|nr:AI-2E family transporter [Xanthomonadales bacterium]